MSAATDDPRVQDLLRRLTRTKGRYRAIGRCLSEPAPRKGRVGRPGAKWPAADPEAGAEVGAIAAVSRALAPLTPEEVRRVLDWAGARFERKEGGPL